MKKENYKISLPNEEVGIGLRAPHIDYIINNKPKVAWFEVHSENHYADGGPALDNLIKIRKNYPISLHSVGNSLGSKEGIDLKHAKQLKKLIDIIDPFLVSDHISWDGVNNENLNDLLPIPYTKESLKVISENISKVQDILDREILVENPSTYLHFKESEMDEAEFINLLTKETGCKMLLDVNNIYVSSQNNNEFKPAAYIQKLNSDIVKEIHLAGHSKTSFFYGDKLTEILIDTHNDVVCDEVWEIYKLAIKKFKKTPTLIEWDQDIPEFEVLMKEAKKAKKIIND